LTVVYCEGQVGCRYTIETVFTYHVFWFVLSGVVGITISACRSLFELTCRLIDTLEEGMNTGSETTYFEFVLNLAELAHDLLLGSQSQCARVVLV